MMQPEKLERSDAILQLGRRIASQLTSQRDEDITCAWMGHHIAELIAAADDDPSDEKLRDDCVRTILEIWTYKSSLPDGARPFEEMEPVLRTLAALDPESTSRFFSHRFDLDSHSDQNGENTWISLSRCIDSAARVVIQCCLEQAASELAGNSDEWAKIAKEAEMDLGILEPILLLTHGDEKGNAKAHRESRKERTKSRMEQLDVLLKASAHLKEELRRSLKELENGA
ncbi:hypothetical protein [Tritonibacter scottomollicae]|uniref:hypothetical protein n=1 Tax=Tritonibacter scottomollicae TaxID=483013 RepID=UPI003AA96E6C